MMNTLIEDATKLEYFTSNSQCAKAAPTPRFSHPLRDGGIFVAGRHIHAFLEENGNSGATSAFVEAEPLAETADVAFDCAGILACSGLRQLR